MLVNAKRAKLAIAWSVVAGVVLAASIPRSDAAAATPREIVRQLTDQVIAVLKKKDLSANQKVSEIQNVVNGYVDYETMSRLVLARNWRTLTDQQKQQFVQEFKRHLAVTYGKNVESYHNEKVQIVGDRDEGRNDWTVETKIIRAGGGSDILVNYRLRRESGDWRIIDLVIERVSLVSNFRSQFQEIMANGGIDRLLKLLREKNAAGQSLKS
jgi:phospholipid transport system substrate-binding protein